jgi:hypothetical protein
LILTTVASCALLGLVPIACSGSGNGATDNDSGPYPPPPYYGDGALPSEDGGAQGDSTTGPTGDSGTQTDSTTATDSGTTDSNSITDSNVTDTSITDSNVTDTSITDSNVTDTSNPADTNVADTATSTDAGTVALVSAVPVGGKPTALALDPVGQKLYVAITASSATAGIAVVDTATATVLATIPPPSGAVNSFTNLALDATHGVIYAASYVYGNATVFGFNVTTGGLVSSIDLYTTHWAPDGGPDAGAPDTSAGVLGLAVNPATQKLYAQVYDDVYPPTFNGIAVIDVSTTTWTVTAGLDLTNESWPSQSVAASTIALDTSSGLLYIAGERPAFAGGGVDIFSTATNALTGSQIALSGSLTGIAAVPGFAAATTANTLEILEPASISLPSNFESTRFAVAATPVGSPFPIRVFGYDATSNAAEVTSYSLCGDSALTQTPVMNVPLTWGYEVGLAQSAYSAATATGTAWITQVPNFGDPDASAFPALEDVYQLTFTGDVVSTDGDAGCSAHDH